MINGKNDNVVARRYASAQGRRVTTTPITRDSIIEGFRVSNHAWRKSGLERGATEELVSATVRDAREAGTVVIEMGAGKFAENTIAIFTHAGITVVTDSTRHLILSI